MQTHIQSHSSLDHPPNGWEASTSFVNDSAEIIFVRDVAIPHDCSATIRLKLGDQSRRSWMRTRVPGEDDEALAAKVPSHPARNRLTNATHTTSNEVSCVL